MSRNKENNPLFTTQRHGQAASLGHNLPSEDFFTDSIISSDSRIPSPSPQKIKPMRPRRAIGNGKPLQATRDLGNKAQRSSLAEYTNSRLSRLPQPSSPVALKRSSSPRRTNDITTPPQSRDGPPLNSPAAEFSSPPHGLTDTYQRIADEEDLAATERDDSDEDVEDDGDDTLGSYLNAGPPSDTGHAPKAMSRASTPVQLAIDTDKENMAEYPTESLSAPPTLDFIQNEMTDRVLAAKLTPYAMDRVKDRARLARLRQNYVPIDFGNSPRRQSNGSTGEHRRNDLARIANRGPISFDNISAVKTNGTGKAHSDTSIDAPQKRAKAFSRAYRKTAEKEEDDDGSDTPPELRAREKIVAFSKANRRKGQQSENQRPQSPDPGPKLVAFSHAYGRPRPFGAPSELGGQQEGNGEHNDTVTSTASEPLPDVPPPLDDGTKPRPDDKLQAARLFLAKWRQETAQKREEKKNQLGEGDSSHIDWAVAAADVPLPSIEKSSTPQGTPPQSALQSSVQKQRSVDRFRKWDNDFTGLSFQVSESPPVRSRPNLNESLTKKEIEQLSKQAVTTNRLDEIRFKDPNVIVRKTSRSFSPEERRHFQPDPAVTHASDAIVGPLDEGERIPDTPVVVYRSSSTNSENSNGSQRAAAESQRSLDHLQRLARAASTTPKASPPPQQPLDEVHEDTTQDDILAAYEGEDETTDESPMNNQNGELGLPAPKVLATPKVTGAWTDTILPDTVKTQKSMLRQPKYMQTPHVNAGAWIDTPLPGGNSLPAPSMPETIEEATEELTNGEVLVEESPIQDHRAEATTSDVPNQREAAPESRPSPERQVILPQSALSNVLNEAKQKRLVSRDIADARDDTLNLGDATIQSFEDLLTDAADITADLTSLIKTNAEDEAIIQRQLALAQTYDGDSATAEVAFIGHLTSRMERLMSNLHEARKGISRLEQRVSHSPSPPSPPPPTGKQAQVQQSQALVAQDPAQACVACGRNTDIDLQQPHLHKHTHAHHILRTNRFLPMTYSTFTLPIQLLFYPRRKDRGEILPRPTWLGWVTLALWAWYITECVFAEMYAHPLYAERYVWPTVPEPEFPFVLPTMLARWSQLDSFLPILGKVFVAIWRVVGMALGLTDGFVDDQSVLSGSGSGSGVGALSVNLASATKAAMGAARSLVSAGQNPRDVDLSMMSDEFI
ncbi:hypothetical protein LTR47_010251 [Exophiala xenobiotica]|nr:hypothetical protein LTR47_010251 [Exophiala xenobiotica]KAK5248580.1 hypothetical protein LTS06_006398 [Exophiala xenobiotica]KAK5283303.1 hypothetical protein LTR40_001970 [Exophiala xenobiotica]KAK5345483.1 hypothetical protein LTR61_010744 [Exophiala xenobiotica]KAK5358728.1 hypothetical protein LTR11_010829 [Exophiala xenobiotica]